MADFTCALATGMSKWMPDSRSRDPPVVTGGLPSVVRTVAPIRRKGPATLSIGRRDRDSSPTSVVGNGWPASRPMKSRVDVPELPRSSAAGAWRRPWRPTPWTVTRVSSGCSISTPIARSAASVARQSSPGRKPEISLVPVAIAPSINARCEMDLSPGTRMVPSIRSVGLIVKDSPAMGFIARKAAWRGSRATARSAPAGRP